MFRLVLPMPAPVATQLDDSKIPTTLLQTGAARFWLAVVGTGIGAGVSAIILTRLLELVQHVVWNGSGTHILEAALHAGFLRHIGALVGAGLATGVGQLLLVRLTSGNGIDITSAIWFSAGRLPMLRTLGSALLSVVVVGMGVSLGREGAPKQAGAVAANVLSDRVRQSDEQRRLLDACGAGATPLRDRKVFELLDTVRIDILKGNASEIARIAGQDIRTKGVDSGEVGMDLGQPAQRLAMERNLTVVVTGEQDIVADTGGISRIHNGHALMTKVVGTGCMAASVIGTFAAVCPDHRLAAAAALACYGIAAELAARHASGPASFKGALIDCLYGLDQAAIEARQKVV